MNEKIKVRVINKKVIDEYKLNVDDIGEILTFVCSDLRVRAVCSFGKSIHIFRLQDLSIV